MAASFDARKFVNDIANAIGNNEIDKILAYYAENAELQDPSTQTPLRGKQAIRENYLQWSKAFSEMRVDLRDVVTSGNDVALRFEVSGRHTGDLTLGPGETIPATNKNVRMEVADFLKIDGSGKIVSDHTLFDVAAMLIQLGLMPSPGATAPGEGVRARR